MSGMRLWLAVDWSAPEPALRALEAYVRSVRAGDPVQLAVAAGPLTEADALERLTALMHGDPELAARMAALPDIAVCAGEVPAEVDAHLRLPGAEAGLHVLREELAPYVAVTPVLNQEDWARTWSPEPGFRHLVVDNASDDDTAKILADRGADVVVNDRRLSRVENWRRALEVFLELTDAPWMKWLFAGDRLLPGAADLLDRSLAAHPEARVACFEYQVRNADGGITRFHPLSETKLVSRTEALYRFVLQGNWMGAPIAVAVHRGVVAQAEYGSHSWVADWQASLSLARRYPVLHVSRPIGVFDGARSRYHSAHEHDMATVVQDVAMRYQALELLRESGAGAHLDLHELEDKLDQMALGGIAHRFEAKRQAAEAPPAARVALAEGGTAGGVARLRLGGAPVGA